MYNKDLLIAIAGPRAEIMCIFFPKSSDAQNIIRNTF